ncbi:MAG TPA: methyltransferase domain-containing protein [Desulfobacterales bacterium]|nr:methyltransferase domain-containing protein [Desulfobacterales bacterium]
MLNVEKHQRSVTGRFSLASATYHGKADVQKTVARKLLSLVAASRPAGHVLEIGCGTGVLTELLMKHFPTAMIDAIDASRAMIAQARDRLSADNHIRWFISDIKTFDSPVSYRLVVSSSSMHWIFPVEDGLRCMADFLEAGGDAVVALMLHGTLGELRTTRLRVAPHKPLLGRLPLAEEVLSGLESAGLRVVAKWQETIRANHVSAEAFLRTIHEQGLTGGMVSSSKCPLTRGELQRLRAEYETEYHNGDSGVFASYEVLYFRATKSELHS